MKPKRSPLPIAGAALIALFLAPGPSFAAQGRSVDAKAAEIGQKVNRLADRDLPAARALAWSTSQDFRKAGASVMAGRFGLQALKLDAEAGNWQSLAKDGIAARDDLTKELDEDEIALFFNLLMHAQGMIGDRNGQQKSAADFVERAIAQSGEDSRSEIMARITGAYSFLETGDTKEGFDRLQAALRHAAAGKNDGLAISEYTTAAQSFANGGQNAAANAFFKEGLATNAAKRESRELATLWFEYSRFLQRSGGDVDMSIRAAHTARIMLQRQFGEKSEKAISGGDNLASLLVYNGAIASGLNIQEEIYHTAIEALGPKVPLTWRAANNFAEALRMVDHPEVARGIDEALLKLRIAHYGHASIQALVSASNLGFDLLALGDKEGALKAFEEQRKIGAEIADPNSEHAEQGQKWKDYTEAYFLRHARMDNKSLEKMAAIKDWRSAPELMRVKTAQLAAEQFDMRGNTDRALALRQEAHAISKAAFGELNPLSFDVQLEVVVTHMRRGDVETLDAFRHLDRQMFDWMLREVGTSGNRYVAETTRRLADDMLRTFGEYAISSPAAAAAYADAVARWKTMESGERTRLRLASETIADPQTRRSALTVVRLLGEQQELLSSGDVDASVRNTLARLGEARKSLPKSLGEEITTQPVEDALDTDAAMVDFFISAKRARNGNAESSNSRLQAIVRRKGEAPAVFDLGPLEQILKQTVSEEAADTRFGKLYKSLFGPLKTVLDGKAKLYVIPDAALYSLPFALMKTEDGRHLDEAFEVHMLTREDAIFFAGKGDRPAAGEKALVVGDLKYDRQQALPFTRREIREVEDDLKAAGLDVASLSGTKGREAPIRTASADASIIHLATHGFFADASDAENADALWRSGLVLAGKGDVENPSISDEDGILYARELMDWDLSSTDLVVLSACQTALGDPSRIGNVRGLPTALAIAGARRSLLTLWSVDDEGTANFMARFYKILAEDKLDYAAALRKTRIEAMSGKIDKAGDPSLWAAFVLFEG